MRGEGLLILALLFLLFSVSFVRKGWSSSPGQNRAIYIALGTGAIVVAGLGLTWAGALFFVLWCNMLLDHQPSARLALSWYPTIMLALVYVWVPWQLPADATVWLAGGIVAVGVATGLWAWISWYRWNGEPWAWWWIEKPWKVGVWEIGGQLSAGQLNMNHAQGVAVVACAASIGLASTQSLWWLLALPLTASTIGLVEWRDRQMLPDHARSGTQGLIHLVHLSLFGITPLLLGWWLLWWIVPLYLVAVLPLVSYAIRNPNFLDSGRCKMWTVMLVGGWWRHSWRVRILGQGWGAWWQGHNNLEEAKAQGARSEMQLWSTAHNDYVQMLLEHGLIGLIALVGFLGERLYLTGLYDPTTYLMGIAICSVALLSFPWTLFHQTYTPDPKGTITLDVGSPTLNVLALIIALLAGRL